MRGISGPEKAQCVSQNLSERLPRPANAVSVTAAGKPAYSRSRTLRTRTPDPGRLASASLFHTRAGIARESLRETGTGLATERKEITERNCRACRYPESALCSRCPLWLHLNYRESRRQGRHPESARHRQGKPQRNRDRVSHRETRDHREKLPGRSADILNPCPDSVSSVSSVALSRYRKSRHPESAP